MESAELWSLGLTAGLALFAWVLHSAHAELGSLRKLLNITREEIARDYTTKSESKHDIDRVITRLDALDAKLDRLMER